MRITGRLLAILITLLVALPAVLNAQGLKVSGYADFEAVFNNVNGDNTDFYFDNHHFNVIFFGQLSDNIFASAEVEYEHAGEEIKVEFGYLSYTGLKNVSVSAGKFIVPFGRFNKDLHPTWINKLPGRPLGFSQVLPQTYSDVGLWLTGAAPIKGGNRFTFDAYIVNGLMGDNGGSIRSMRDNDREKRDGERDDNKAIGARVGLELAPRAFDIGASVYTGNYSNDFETDLTLTLLGVDAAYRYLDLELRGEWILASQEATTDDLDKSGGYLQAAYRINKFEPVLRYSTRDLDSEGSELSRLGIGFSIYLSNAAALRVAYLINMEEDGFESDNDGLMFQFTTTF